MFGVDKFTRLLAQQKFNCTNDPPDKSNICCSGLLLEVLVCGSAHAIFLLNVPSGWPPSFISAINNRSLQHVPMETAFKSDSDTYFYSSFPRLLVKMQPSAPPANLSLILSECSLFSQEHSEDFAWTNCLPKGEKTKTACLVWFSCHIITNFIDFYWQDFCYCAHVCSKILHTSSHMPAHMWLN